LKKRFQIPLIVDYRDSWYGNQFTFNPTPYHSYKHKSLEDRALRAVDKIIVVNRIIKENLLQTFPFLTFDDVIIIPHGFDPEDFRKVVHVNDNVKKMKILYSGIFYENVTPKYLLKAFKVLAKERPDVASNIELQFVGHFRKENINLVKRLGLESFVRNFSYLNHEETVKKIVSADILWVMLGEKNMKTVSAGKLFEYIGSRKPILATVPDGATKTAAKNYRASFITKPNDITEIKNMLIKIHDLFLSSNLPTPDENFINQHDRIILTEQLTKIFQFYLRTDL